ncbi:hypothetical protein RUM43_004357 [Polyplax serrata]|uniref:Syntaxin N-terminal domain-containing protein n=1 Tax=Polyplax serrata TaxID=468196 RepID=A0AAN8SAS4_POLSC
MKHRSSVVAMNSKRQSKSKILSVLNPSSQNYTELLTEINSQLALFRDMLIHIGQSKDSPELREKIRKTRRSCVEGCKHTSQLLLPQIKRQVPWFSSFGGTKRVII